MLKYICSRLGRVYLITAFKIGETALKIKDGFVIDKVGESYFAVAVGETATEFNAIIKMNGVGAFLWELMSSGDPTPRELLDATVSEYGVDEAVAKRDIASFLDKLKAEGLIEV